jgi:hypothetical protein
MGLILLLNSCAEVSGLNSFPPSLRAERSNPAIVTLPVCLVLSDRDPHRRVFSEQPVSNGETPEVYGQAYLLLTLQSSRSLDCFAPLAMTGSGIR